MFGHGFSSKHFLGPIFGHYATYQKVAGSIPYEVNFLYLPNPPAALGQGVYSVSNRNEYQKH
jgi:hypothetical protein